MRRILEVVLTQKRTLFPHGAQWKYTGREYDGLSKLQYNRARYYDPVTGRWTSQDPLGFDAGDSNLYRYAGNNPTNRSDPSGWYSPLRDPLPDKPPIPWFLKDEKRPRLFY